MRRLTGLAPNTPLRSGSLTEVACAGGPRRTARRIPQPTGRRPAAATSNRSWRHNLPLVRPPFPPSHSLARNTGLHSSPGQWRHRDLRECVGGPVVDLGGTGEVDAGLVLSLAADDEDGTFVEQDGAVL